MKSYIVIIVMALLSSCTIQPRLYRSGYHIESSIFSKAPKEKTQVKEKVSKIKPNKSEIKLTNKVQNLDLKSVPLLVNLDTLKCDTIFFKDGSRVVARIETIKEKEVSYKKCSNIIGPLYYESTESISFVVFSNGDVEKVGSRIKSDSQSSAEYVSNDVIRPTETKTNKDTKKKLEGFGLVSFMTYLVGLAVVMDDMELAGVLGIISLLLAAISFARFNKNRENLSGIAFPIIVIVLFLVGLLLAI